MDQVAADRGLLDISVALSTRQITAGKQFSLFVLLKNPFTKPVFVHRVHVSLPSELEIAVDPKTQVRAQELDKARTEALQTMKMERQALEKSFEEMTVHLRELRSLFPKRENNLAEAPFGEEALAELRRIAGFYISAIKRARERLRAIDLGAANIELFGSRIDTLKIESASPSIELRHEDDKESSIGVLHISDPMFTGQKMAGTWEIVLQSSLPDGCALQPSSTAVYTAVLNVKKSLIVTPSSYRLQFNVNYGFSTNEKIQRNEFSDEEVFTNTISHEIAIRPSVYSVISGSALGGLIGSVARLLQNTYISDTIATSVVQPSAVRFVGTVILAIILSSIAVIFMARKSDAQSFISVEDFWGGILIGFLIGYTGTAFFTQLTGISIAGISPTATPPAH
jgi:hypothetical protein